MNTKKLVLNMVTWVAVLFAYVGLFLPVIKEKTLNTIFPAGLTSFAEISTWGVLTTIFIGLGFLILLFLVATSLLLIVNPDKEEKLNKIKNIFIYILWGVLLLTLAFVICGATELANATVKCYPAIGYWFFFVGGLAASITSFFDGLKLNKTNKEN